MPAVTKHFDEAQGIPPVPPAITQYAETLPRSDTPFVLTPPHWSIRCVMFVASPGLALIEFVKHIFSPGLNDVPTLTCERVRNGGQHRY